jgi:myo-inositol-1(or 4)-monophosphatase
VTLHPNDVPDSPSLLADIALAIAVDAAALVRTRRAEGFDQDTKSTATDIVTDVDRASDEFIRAELSRLRPDDGWLTEETGRHQGTTEICWVVDPIDGTTNFVYGHPPFAVSIAACVRDVPVAAAIVEIARDERYRAALGQGATCDGVTLRARPAVAPALALVGTGFAYDPARRMRQAEMVRKLIGSVRDIRRLGAAAYDLASVASSRLDAYVEHGLQPWDLAAGRLICTESGLEVESIDDARPLEGDVLVARRELIGPLRELLLAAGARDV